MNSENTTIPTLENMENQKAKDVFKSGSETDIRTFLIDAIKKKAKLAGYIFDFPEAETKWASNKLDKLLEKSRSKGMLVACKRCKLPHSNAKTGPLLREVDDKNEITYVHRNCQC